MKIRILLLFIILNSAFLIPLYSESYIRVNQIGFFPDDVKNAVIFSKDNIGSVNFSIIRTSDNQKVWGPNGLGKNHGPYAAFPNNFVIEFSGLRDTGKYKIVTSDGAVSPEFEISECVYKCQQDEVLNFFHQQRCGYNPFLGKNCHMFTKTSIKDGKVIGGAFDGKTLDASGGWHDAGDYIKFMITSTNVTYFLLFAYRENPEKFGDNYDAYGRPGTNNIPDVLDEAKWGLDWMLRMHPAADEFFYQVGGEKDHYSYRLPFSDTVQYETFPYRPIYSGVGANNCGRAAACFAMAYSIWKNDLKDEKNGALYLKTAKELYKLGSDNMRAQPSTPPDFYGESTFIDDMELGAAELYLVTKNKKYLTDAERYAISAGSANGWLDWGSISYIAHYVLYPYASSFTQEKIKAYMQQDIGYNSKKAAENPFGMSVDYVWGSMANLTGTIIKAALYKKLFNDSSYSKCLVTSRDYLLGKNQWGVCFVVGMGTRWPHYVHGQVPDLTRTEVHGMPIEGPLPQADFNALNIRLNNTSPDLAVFDSEIGIYHDDMPDYASNEMTIWQGALTVAMFSIIASEKDCEDRKPWVREGPVLKENRDSGFGTRKTYFYFGLRTRDFGLF